MENSQPTVEWTALQQFWELMEDDGEAVEDLIDTFLDDAPGNVKKIQVAFDNDKMDEVGILAHTMKGSSATLGVMRFSEYCRAIEAACKTNETIDFAGIIEQLTEEFAVAVKVLGQWREHLQNPN
ncbi:MAG: Hpt domain-containing protein [Planctomycetota bacterium]|nr:Hpt domain-containing protein [Planctomycetota bacterium]